MLINPQVKSYDGFSLNAKKVQFQKRSVTSPIIIDFEKELQSQKEQQNENGYQNEMNRQSSLAQLEKDNESETFPSTDDDEGEYVNFDQSSDSCVYEELKGYNFTQKIDSLFKRLKENPFKINIFIDIPFQYLNCLVSFANAISKIAKHVRYLKWNINSLFSMGKYVYIFSDSLALFTNLYKLELLFNSNNSFNHKGAKSLFEGIKKLTNLHIFKFDIQKVDYNKQNTILLQIANDLLNSGIFSESIEIISSNVLNFHSPQNFPNLSVLYVNGYNQYKELDYFRKHIRSLSTHLTAIYFNEYIISMFIRQIKAEQGKEIVFFFKEIQDLPYLTFFKHIQLVLVLSIHYQNYLQDIERFIHRKHIKLLEVISFEKNIKQYMILNPRIVLADLLIN